MDAEYYEQPMSYATYSNDQRLLGEIERIRDCAAFWGYRGRVDIVEYPVASWIRGVPVFQVRVYI